MDYIARTASKIPVVDDADICIIGGSCTGVFAAVRAARLGARVVLIEQQNALGGTAASGLVNVWHSLQDTTYSRQVIAGLTDEVIKRLGRVGAVDYQPEDVNAYRLNTEELKVVLDDMVCENRIRVYLHTSYIDTNKEGDMIQSVIIHNKNGCQAIRAGVFIDASGDGDLAKDAGCPVYTHQPIQPPTACAKIRGDFNGVDVGKIIFEHGAEEELPADWGWGGTIPNCDGIQMRADLHVSDVDCSDADQLTRSEIIGRRQISKTVKLLNRYGNHTVPYALVDTCSYIGIRESRHIGCDYRIKEMELLEGKRYDDAVMNGTYRVDIHQNDSTSLVFKYLDGTMEIIKDRTNPAIHTFWKQDRKACASFYQAPFRSLIPQSVQNLLIAGRMLDADEGAFGALRVMVNLNQMGEAAGVGAYLALADRNTHNLDAGKVRKTLSAGGSIIL